MAFRMQPLRKYFEYLRLRLHSPFAAVDSIRNPEKSKLRRVRHQSGNRVDSSICGNYRANTLRTKEAAFGKSVLCKLVIPSARGAKRRMHIS